VEFAKGLDQAQWCTSTRGCFRVLRGVGMISRVLRILIGPKQLDETIAAKSRGYDSLLNEVIEGVLGACAMALADEAGRMSWCGRGSRSGGRQLWRKAA
jgi:hypothetical protein